MERLFLAIAAIFGGLAVGGGAFASHALKDRLSEKALAIFETGIRYQMYHALALLLVAILLRQTEFSRGLLTTTGITFIAGIFLFSGSLYTLSLTGIKWLGAITPLGGLAFLAGWGCLVVVALGAK
ncbi:MAG: DUF423 domain-containing protein [Cyanobacteria bacterium SBLK]|nr:DUF423 domain-containing protein [Cyanobacteria bacterium SBLK]